MERDGCGQVKLSSSPILVLKGICQKSRRFVEALRVHALSQAMIYDARVRSFLIDMQVGIVSQTKGAPAILPKVANALGRSAGRRVPRHFHAYPSMPNGPVPRRGRPHLALDRDCA